jgi:hypothetical protein
MNAKEAAEKLRPSFHLDASPPEDRRRSLFVEQVATELGVEHTPFNLHQVSAALEAADVHEDAGDYPKMLYSREHHAVEGVAASVFDPRHDHMWVHVENEDQEHALGAGWIADHTQLPPRAQK